jgi:hypothetical protein
MKNILSILVLSVILFGCDLFVDEDKSNSQKIIETEHESDRIEPIYTKDDFKKYLDDYFSFYKRKCKYKNEVFRRVDNNTFLISLDEDCFNRDYDMYFNIIYRFNINNDGTYDCIVEQGSYSTPN